MDRISIRRPWVNRTHLHSVSERAHCPVDPQISFPMMVWSQSESHYCFGLGHNCLLPTGLTAAEIETGPGDSAVNWAENRR